MSREFALSNAGRAWLRRIETLHPSGPDPTLIAARRIARNSPHAVTIDGQSVHVTLVGRHHKHQLTLDVPPWNPTAADIVDDLTRRHPIVALDDLPDYLLTSLLEHRIDLAPHIDEIHVRPPDAARRLTLAALYKLVQRIDEDPRQALVLRLPASHEHGGPTPDAAHFVPLSDLDPARFYAPGP